MVQAPVSVATHPASRRPGAHATALLALLALALPLSADAVVRGDHHFKLVDSPIILDASLVIESDSSLTIEPGVEIRMPEAAIILVQGRLTAMGAGSRRIRFVPTAPGGSWGGLRIEGGDVAMHAVQIERADSGVVMLGGGILLDEVEVRDSGGNGIEIGGVARVRMFDCVIAGSGDAGVIVRDGRRLEMIGARIHGNVTGIEVQAGGEVLMRASEVMRNSGVALRLQAGASALVEVSALHDNDIGVEVADAEGVILGLGNDLGGGNVLGCNRLDVVNASADPVQARGNYWGGGPALLVSGAVDSSGWLDEMPAEVRQMERLFVRSDRGGIDFDWQSVADCAEHSVLASDSPLEPFEEVPGAVDQIIAHSQAGSSSLVFFQLETAAWSSAGN